MRTRATCLRVHQTVQLRMVNSKADRDLEALTLLWINDPGRRSYHRGLTTPVAVRISTYLEAFDRTPHLLMSLFKGRGPQSHRTPHGLLYTGIADRIPIARVRTR